MTTRPLITIVLPVLDEAASITACIAEARRGLAQAEVPGEIIVVDNGSVDGSPGLARSAGARVVRETTTGYGAALRRGIAEARGEIIVMADADGTYDLGRLTELIAPILHDDADIVVGGRLAEPDRGSMPLLHRYVGTPVLSMLVRRAAGELAVRDSQSGFRAIRRAAAQTLGLKATGMEFASEMLIRAAQQGLTVREVDLGYRRRTGDSKLRTLRDGVRHLQLILMLAPHLLLVWPGAIMLAVGSLLGVTSVIRPAGITLGSVSWQPIFFGPILIVLGSLAIASGVVVAQRSPLVAPEVAMRFRRIDPNRMATVCLRGGAGLLATGLAIDAGLFVVWLTGDTSPPQALGLAGIAQALIITGASLAGLGVMQRVLTLRDRYVVDDSVDVGDLVGDRTRRP